MGNEWPGLNDKSHNYNFRDILTRFCFAVKRSSSCGTDERKRAGENHRRGML